MTIPILRTGDIGGEPARYGFGRSWRYDSRLDFLPQNDRLSFRLEGEMCRQPGYETGSVPELQGRVFTRSVSFVLSIGITQ